MQSVIRTYNTGTGLDAGISPGGSTRAPLRSTSSTQDLVSTRWFSNAACMAADILSACSAGAKAMTVGPEPESEAP